MWNVHRRTFLASSLAATVLAGATKSLFGANQVERSHDPLSEQYSPDTLFATWQRDPTTSIAIQWIGQETTADMGIRYAPLADSDLAIERTIVKPYTNTDLKVYRCELRNLKPGAEYRFQIGSSFPSYRFRTMPSSLTDEFQFVSGGDSGVGEEALVTNRLAALQDPAFVLMAGDLAYDNGRSPETFTKYLQNYNATMLDSEGRLIPMLSCIGNHEVDGGYGVGREKSPQYLSLFDGLFADRTYNTLDFGNFLSLVLLDTGHIAPIEGEQTEWLRQVLKDRQDYPHLLVANHVPAYPCYRAPEGANGEKGTGHDQRKYWSPLFEQYKVDAVLEHHDHAFKRTHPLTGGLHDRNGVVYLGDGSWGKLRIPKTPEERPYLAKVAKAYHLTMHSLQGDSRVHLAMTEGGKVADVFATHKKRPSRRG